MTSNTISNNNAMVKIFESEQFGQVRTVMVDNEPWFVAIDVCKALDISNSRDAISRLDEDEKNTVALTDGNRGNPNMAIVSESGLYSLTMRSRKPEAKQFKRWITHDILPTLRKTGTYSMQDAIFEKFPQTPRDYRSALLALVDQIDINESLTKQNKILSGEKLTWDNSALLNALIRKYASCVCDNKFGVAWKSFYKELLYKHGLNLESRKSRDLDKNPKNLNRATYKYLSNEEWQGAIETAVAMCVANNVDISSIIKEKVQTEEIAVC